MRTESTQSRLPRIVTSLLFASQAASVLLAAYLWEYGGAKTGLTTENMIAVGMAVVVFPLLGILGVVWAISSAVKRWESRPVAIAFLVASVGMCTSILPLHASRLIGPMMRPWVRARQAEAAHRDRARYVFEKTAHYEALRTRFKTPQRVADARDGLLRLADGLVVEVVGFEGARGGNERFRSWTAEHLVGRDVRIVLPDRLYFDDNYVPGMRRGFEGTRPRDAGTGVRYGNVPAVVLLEGDIVNAQFSSYPEELEAWCRQHVPN